MFSHFRLIPFLVGLGSAMMVFLVWKPSKQVITEYPHPVKGEKNIYRDPNHTCYTYTTHEVDCDANEATLKDYPIQG